jgi:myo-inositol-1-phosphate synthase
MDKIRIAVIGVGNCASSLLQGIEYYRHKNGEDAIGLMHWDIAGYKPYDVEVVAAFDIDRRKVGKDVNEAIFQRPNCTAVFCEEMPRTGVAVKMGRILDGFSDHMKDYEHDCTFVPSDGPEPTKEDVVRTLNESRTEILLNYLPVGSEEATKFYAECALEAHWRLSTTSRSSSPATRSGRKSLTTRTCRSSVTTSRPNLARPSPIEC